MTFNDRWHMRMQQVEFFFDGLDLPAGPIQLDTLHTITDPGRFVQSHLATVRRSGPSFTYLPYLERLIKLMDIL